MSLTLSTQRLLNVSRQIVTNRGSNKIKVLGSKLFYGRKEVTSYFSQRGENKADQENMIMEERLKGEKCHMLRFRNKKFILEKKLTF